jgi:hypothetical protein
MFQIAIFCSFSTKLYFYSFVYLTLDDMTVKNIIATLQQALQNEIYLSCVFQQNRNVYV